ncbi:hypothetical protein BGZ82_009056 [Podila clonocystis]|nr:hypothetical protein BGZ82_009056 [Podila clonocystis]
MKTCASCSSNKRTKADPEETERTCIKCDKTLPIAVFRWDGRTWRSCRDCSTNKRVLLDSEKYWKRAKVEIPAEARSVKPRRARVHVVDYENLKNIIQDEQGDGDVYIKFPIYVKDPAVDTATFVKMAEARGRKAGSAPEQLRSRVTKDESSDTDESHKNWDEGDSDKDDSSRSEAIAPEELATHHGSTRRSSRLVSKPRLSYYDDENAETPSLEDARLSRTSKNKSKDQPSKKSTSARLRSTLAVARSETIEEIDARVRVISQFLKEEFEVFTGFKWNVRKALELKLLQGHVNARMTYYCGQIKDTGGALKDPSKRTGQGGRKSSVRYDCGGRLVFFINLTDQVCVVRYKHTAHPPRPGFSPATIPDAVIEAMQKLALEEGDSQDAKGQEMYDHLVASKLIRRKQLQPLRIAFRWLQIRESRMAKCTTLSRSSTSIPKAIRATNTKNETLRDLADTSPEKDEEVEADKEEDEKKSEKSIEKVAKAESGKERTDKKEEDEAKSEEYANSAVDDDDEASEYEEAVESQSQERWATPDLIEEETPSPDQDMEVDQDSEEEDKDSETEDFADQVEVDDSENAHEQDSEAPPESDDATSKQRDIEDIVERMNMLEKELFNSAKTSAEIEAIEKELDLLSSFLTDMF